MLWFNELFFKPLENYFCKFCFKAVKKSRVTHDNGYKRRLQSQITASYSNELRLDVKARRKQQKVNFFYKTVDRGRIFYLQHFRKAETKSTQVPYTNL